MVPLRDLDESSLFTISPMGLNSRPLVARFKDLAPS